MPPCTKNSFGIACLRHGPSGNLEILIINKRYTYAFCDFVHGKYDPHDDYSILRLLNKMTFDERVHILSFNFDHLWYWIWLDDVYGGRLREAKFGFESKFGSSEGRKRLRGLIARAAGNDSKRIWEMPKGRKARLESDLDCAVREFSEETRFDREDFEILHGAKRKHTYVDDGVRYNDTYFFAYMRNRGEEALTYSDRKGQLREISGAKWVTLADIPTLDPSMKLSAMVRPIFNFVKKQIPHI